jgi:hypothetical protein
MRLVMGLISIMAYLVANIGLQKDVHGSKACKACHLVQPQ